MPCTHRLSRVCAAAVIAVLALAGCSRPVDEEPVVPVPAVKPAAAPPAPPAPPAPAVSVPAPTAAPAPAPAVRIGLPELVVPATCAMQIKPAYTNTVEMDRIQAMGVSTVRRGFHWEGIEKQKGVYDFSGHDEVMRELRQRGLRVLGVLAFGNKLYGPVREAEGRAAYARYAAALAAHYKDDHVLWEIWNEPNTMTFWGRHGKKGNSEPYAEEYVNLVKATVPAIRAADPAAIILAGSVSCLWSESFKWTEFCFAKGVLQTGIDAWSVHPYSLKRPEDYIPNYEKVRDMMEKSGAPRDFPMLNSERGFPLDAKAEGYAGGDQSQLRQYQAWHLVRQYLVDLSYGMYLTVWYEWKNAKEGFGIYDGDVSSPAHTAGRVMIEQLRGMRVLRRVPTTSDLDMVLEFGAPDGTRRLVAWTSPPPGQGPDQAVPHELRLAVAAAGAVRVVRLDGAGGEAQVRDGAIAVALSGAPQYIHAGAR